MGKIDSEQNMSSPERFSYGGYGNYISEIICRGKRFRAMRGWAPCRPPFGYLNDLSAKTIIPDPETWGRMRIVLNVAATKRYSISEIANFANCDLSLKRNGRPLTCRMLRRMIANPFYMGKFRYNGVLYEGKHRPMITERQFNALQELLNNGANKTRKCNIEININLNIS